LAIVATQILLDERPVTLRGLFYRVVSAGFLPSTDKQHYSRVGRLMTVLRRTKIVPYSWIVDHVRATLKPSSWSGLADFVDTVEQAYRMDFWEKLPTYPHVIVEKDAIAGVLEPVTREFDVALSPIRGYVSLSYANEIASTWSRIEKPITAYYAGDFDPSGFDLERDVRTKLSQLCRRPFRWVRLAVKAEDFDIHNLLPLEPKKKDTRYRRFVEVHGERCAELDAIPATELRRRLRAAIESHVPDGEWERLKELETLQRDQFNAVMAQFRGEVA
jgi:hypothetical protein